MAAIVLLPATMRSMSGCCCRINPLRSATSLPKRRTMVRHACFVHGAHIFPFSFLQSFDFTRKPPPSRPPRTTKDKNRTTLLYLLSLGVATVGASYAAVPLYRIFCQRTGYGGTTGHGDTDKVRTGPRRNYTTGTVHLQIAMPIFSQKKNRIPGNKAGTKFPKVNFIRFHQF